MAGIPSSPLSINQAPQYGDKRALDKLKTGMTTTPMTGVPTPAPTAGRPPGSTTTPQQSTSTGTASSNVPTEHQSLMEQFALATRVKQYWDGIAAQYPSSWSRMYAADADEEYQRLGHEVRAKTPFFNV